MKKASGLWPEAQCQHNRLYKQFELTRMGAEMLAHMFDLAEAKPDVCPHKYALQTGVAHGVLPYEPHLVSFESNDQMSPEFLSLNPNNKIPAILDPNGPGEKPLALFESGACLIYLAEKTGQFIPQDAAGRYEALQWLMWQMGGVGPMFGQLGFFHKFAGKDFEDKRPRDRYVAESKRLLGVLNQRLASRAWIMGDAYSIADIATFPWVRCLTEFYMAGDLVGMQDFPHVTRALAAFVARPAVVRGLTIPSRS